MKKMIKIILIVFSVALIGFDVENVLASENTDNSITVVKLKIDQDTKFTKKLPIEGAPLGSITDDNGSVLKPLKGVTYQIERVTPVQNDLKYDVVKGEGQFRLTANTNEEGLATFTNIPQGTYRVTEQTSNQIPVAMEPVIIELPLPQAQGNSLNHVYIYPKSNYSGKNTNPNKNDKTGTSKKLPQTSGNFGDVRPVFFLIFLATGMGILGYTILNNKYRTNED